MHRPGITDSVGQAGRVRVGGGLRHDLLGGGVNRRSVIEFDGKPLQNLYDFTYALRGKKPGDEVKVKVLREGKPLEVTVVLTRRE